MYLLVFKKTRSTVQHERLMLTKLTAEGKPTKLHVDRNILPHCIKGIIYEVYSKWCKTRKIIF